MGRGVRGEDVSGMGGALRSWWETWKVFLETRTQSLACALLAQ